MASFKHKYQQFIVVFIIVVQSRRELQESMTLCLCRKGPRGGIVVLVHGLMNLAAPYLCSYDVKHLFYGWHALLLKVYASLIPRRKPGDVI